MAWVTIQDFQRAVLNQAGGAPVVLGPGRHWFRRRRSTLAVVDLRPALLRVTGQETLTADGVAVRAAVVVRYTIEDPMRWVLAAAAPDTAVQRLYLATQLAIREVVASQPAQDLLTGRAELSAGLAGRVHETAAQVGAQVQAVDLRDLSFPGELRRSFAQVALARQEAAAALERARGEAATLRSLANAARTLDGNPALRELRSLVAVERSGGTVVLTGVGRSDADASVVRQAEVPDRSNG